MGDKQDGGAEFLFQVVHEPEHLGLDRHVQGGGGLVRDQQLRTAGKGHGDHDALAHTAGELMGILLGHDLGVRDLHVPENLHGLCRGLLLFHVLVNHEHLGDLLLDGEHRVQGGHGLLEDHGDLVAADLVHLLHGDLGQVPAVEQDLAAVDIAVAVQQAEDRHGGDALTGAGLAHDAEGFPFLDAVGGVVHGLDDAAAGGEEGMEVNDFQQGFFLSCILCHIDLLICRWTSGRARRGGRRRSG